MSKDGEVFGIHDVTICTLYQQHIDATLDVSVIESLHVMNAYLVAQPMLLDMDTKSHRSYGPAAPQFNVQKSEV